MQLATLVDGSQAAMACIRFMSDYILSLATRSVKTLDNLSAERLRSYEDRLIVKRTQDDTCNDVESKRDI